jgi:hypothetical protein
VLRVHLEELLKMNVHQDFLSEFPSELEQVVCIGDKMRRIRHSFEELRLQA